MIKIDRLIRTNRKTIALIVENDATLTVRAPKKASQKIIERFINEKKRWIESKQKTLSEMKKETPVRKYENGGMFPFLGKEYELLINDKFDFDFKFDGFNFMIRKELEEFACQVMEHWYRRTAGEIIIPKVQHFSGKYDYYAIRIGITGAKKRWGSCSSKGNLNFSWRLITAPEECVDYVIVHELAHLKEMNHSKRFWNLVENMLPGYKKPLEWLKKNSHLLEI